MLFSNNTITGLTRVITQYSAEYCVITRVRPVIVLLENNTETKTLRIHSGHLVVQLGDNKIYECCYDI